MQLKALILFGLPFIAANPVPVKTGSYIAPPPMQTQETYPGHQWVILGSQNAGATWFVANNNLCDSYDITINRSGQADVSSNNYCSKGKHLDYNYAVGSKVWEIFGYMTVSEHRSDNKIKINIINDSGEDLKLQSGSPRVGSKGPGSKSRV